MALWLTCTLSLLGLTFVVADAAASLGIGAAGPSTAPFQHCTPDAELVSGCMWTDSCRIGGCEDRCIASTLTAGSRTVLRDRSVSEGSYLLCPQATFIHTVSLMVAAGLNRRRRLHSRPDQVMDLSYVAGHLEALTRHDSRVWSPRHRIAGGGARPGRGILDLSSSETADTPEATGPAAEPAGTAPEATGPATGPSIAGANLPSNACPTKESLAEAAPPMRELALAFLKVLDAGARGESIPADLSTWEFILLQPNTYRLLSEYMLDPDRLFEYVSTRCQTEVVQKPKAEAYSNLLPMDEQPLLDAQLTHVQCVDTFGAYEQYARNLVKAEEACQPPFGEPDDCFGIQSWQLLSSRECALAHVALYNVTTPTRVLEIVASVRALQEECSAITSQAECAIADSSILDDINQKHDSLPMRQVDLSAFLPDPVEATAVAPVTLTNPTDTSAPSTGGGNGAEIPAGVVLSRGPPAAAAGPGSGSGGNADEAEAQGASEGGPPEADSSPGTVGDTASAATGRLDSATRVLPAGAALLVLMLM